MDGSVKIYKYTDRDVKNGGNDRDRWREGVILCLFASYIFKFKPPFLRVLWNWKNKLSPGVDESIYQELEIKDTAHFKSFQSISYTPFELKTMDHAVVITSEQKITA